MKKFKIFGHVQVEKSSVLSIETHDVIWYIKNKLMQDSLGEACTEKLQSYASIDFTGLHKTKQISSSSFRSSKQSKTRKHCFYYPMCCNFEGIIVEGFTSFDHINGSLTYLQIQLYAVTLFHKHYLHDKTPKNCVTKMAFMIQQ